VQNQWKNKQQEYFDNQYNITRNLTDLLKPVSEVKEQIKASKEPLKLQPSSISKIDAKTDPRPTLEYHKPRAVKEIADDTPSYYDQAVEDERKIKEAEDFAYFSQFAQQGIYILKGNEFYIGKTKINLKLVDNDEQVEIYAKDNKYTFYKHEFEDLFGSDKMPDFYDTINKGTFSYFITFYKNVELEK